jgi:hypothetical protein
MKNIKIDSIVRVKSVNFNDRVRVIAVERNIVTACTIHGKIVTTHIRNIREDK